jgi:class 3 adenylate cyclase/esterase/lipase
VFRLPDTRFATNDGLTIAYQQFGEGDADVVFVPGFMSHVELNWEFSFYASLLARLGEFARVLVLDKRGTGLSDRSLGHGTLEERMSDVRAVMDHAGVERATLIGISEGAAMSVLMAASDPLRVSSLVLMGAMCPGAAPLDGGETTKYLGFIEAKWHTGRVVEMFVQHAPDRDEARASLARFERYCCTPAVAADVMRHNIDSDVRAVLPAIAVPTLVIHQRDDPMVPVWHAEFYAAHIPGSTLRILPGDFHGSWRPSDYDLALDAIQEFVTGEAERPRAPAQRMLATVLFTDIVGSTATASELGDRRWRELLDRHDQAARDAVESHGGVFVKSNGDGILAHFDGPTRAVACAHAFRHRIAHLGIELRAGAHTGEIELRDNDIGGIGVHIAARVAAEAAPGEVLVSRTVKDLTAGSGLHFDDRGEFELRGVPERWQLYAVTA